MDISVIIPTYNRKEQLKKCLEALFEQENLGKSFEIIVVDDGSTDGTAIMLKNLLEKHSHIKYLYQLHKGPACARNLGIKSASGSIIAFIDDDCIAQKNFINSMIYAHQNDPQTAAIGGITFICRGKIPTLASQFLSTGSIETNINAKKETIFLPTCNVSFKRIVFEKHKFNEQFKFPGGEDLELFWRLFKDGDRFLWNKDIGVVHERDVIFRSFIKQAYFYGRGNLLVQYLHGDHPLLSELKIGVFSFWIATLINIIKIPRFSYILGKKLIGHNNIRSFHSRISIYAYFFIHKFFYIVGNIVEFFRILKECLEKNKTSYSVPELLILDITHSCNLNCKICDIWKTGAAEKNMHFSYIKKTLLQAKELSIANIALSGGEPLLRKDIFELFDYARSLNIKNLGVLTNGILVRSLMDTLKSYLLDNTISLVLSLDSLVDKTHNYIRNSSNVWHQTMESLKELALIKEEYPQINFNLITIILNQNLEELVNLTLFVKSLNANSIQFQPLLPNNLRMAERHNSPFWVSRDRLPLLDDTVDQLIKLKEENPQFVRNSIKNLSLMKRYYRANLTSGDVGCASACKTVLISNQGNYTTCFSSYGDIKRQSLEAVLKGNEIDMAQKVVRNCSWPCLLPCFCDI